MDFILERLDMQDGDWGGVEVFVSQEGRSVWGLIPADLHEAIAQLHTLLLEDEDDE